MKNLIVVILGVFLFVALTEGFSIRATDDGVSSQKGGAESQPLNQLIRERRDGWAAELEAACAAGDHGECNRVCQSGGYYMGGCRGGGCRCYE